MTTNFYKLKSINATLQKNQSKGFTLLETLIAISILLVAVIGPMTLLGGALNKIYYARDEMIAVNLAQEGIESVRQIRDTNMLVRGSESPTPTTPWDRNLASGDYIVDIGNLISCPSCGAGGDPVVFDSPRGLYRQGTSGLSTSFSRKVNISGSGDERTITATVTWNTGSTPGSIVISNSLLKWVP
ncbi:MAG: type II secretion system protein [Candidatus Pacebacteria bacterium]|nr:type II secretion system protein [Candidatus Paceibacterota bacterium]